MLRAILLFASTTFLSGIASPNSDLFLVTRRILRQSTTLQPEMDINLTRAANYELELPSWPKYHLTGRLPAPHMIVSARGHTPPGNRIGCVPSKNVRQGHTHKSPSSGWNGRQRAWAHTYLAGNWGLLRSDTLCIFIAPRRGRYRCKFLWRELRNQPPHHNKPPTKRRPSHGTSKLARTTTTNHKRKQTNNFFSFFLRRRNRRRAGVTGAVRRVWRSRGIGEEQGISWDTMGEKLCLLYSAEKQDSSRARASCMQLTAAIVVVRWRLAVGRRDQPECLVCVLGGGGG
jgi:hypothetical protein